MHEDRACAQLAPSSSQPEGRLLMVEAPSEPFSDTETVLRSINELQGGGDAVSKTVPYRAGCNYTFLHGE